tara:strand:- start:118 stop:657 length:540 start_codon:yes stop_codon:yes gene_type:complete
MSTENNLDLETSNEFAPTEVDVEPAALPVEPVVVIAEQSADEMDDPPAEEHEGVIKVKKPRSVKQTESLKKAQIARKQKTELRQAEKVVKAQNVIEDSKPKPPKYDMELVTQLMGLINPSSRPQRSKDDSDSEDSIERLERKIIRKKASRAKKGIPTTPIINQPVKIEKTQKKKMLSFS